MPITTAQLKAAIEAKIAAATGSTSLEDLTLIKNNADTWLVNNSGGTITGYASLETLIQTRQNALTGSSTLDDITLTSASAFPPSGGASLGYKNKVQITSSGNWTVPAGVYQIEIWATGGGAGGAGSASSFAGNGGGASSTGVCQVSVTPGQVVSCTIGAGGAGGIGGGLVGTGGITLVRIGTFPLVISYGGSGTSSQAGGSFDVRYAVLGGGGGAGSTGSSSAGGNGGSPLIYSVSGTISGSITGIPSASGGSVGTAIFPGGGGGSSIYGPGGSGGNGSNTTGTGNNGGNAPSTSYGAGGGGGSSSNTSGGNGAPGIVEIYY